MARRWRPVRRDDRARPHHAWVLYQRGRHAEAVAEHHTLLAFRRGKGLPRNLAIALRDAAAIERAVGLGQAAKEHSAEALALFTTLKTHLDAAMALNVQGEFAAQDGRTREATRHFVRALEAARDCSSSYERARAHHGLGPVAVHRAASAAERGPRRRRRGPRRTPPHAPQWTWPAQCSGDPGMMSRTDRAAAETAAAARQVCSVPPGPRRAS